MTLKSIRLKKEKKKQMKKCQKKAKLTASWSISSPEEPTPVLEPLVSEDGPPQATDLVQPLHEDDQVEVS